MASAKPQRRPDPSPPSRLTVVRPAWCADARSTNTVGVRGQSLACNRLPCVLTRESRKRRCEGRRQPLRIRQASSHNEVCALWFCHWPFQEPRTRSTEASAHLELHPSRSPFNAPPLQVGWWDGGGGGVGGGGESMRVAWRLGHWFSIGLLVFAKVFGQAPPVGGEPARPIPPAHPHCNARTQRPVSGSGVGGITKADSLPTNTPSTLTHTHTHAQPALARRGGGRGRRARGAHHRLTCRPTHPHPPPRPARPVGRPAPRLPQLGGRPRPNDAGRDGGE